MQSNEVICELKAMKEANRLTNRDIAEGSGVPLGTVSRVFSGSGSDFRYETIQPIVQFFEQVTATVELEVNSGDSVDPEIIRLYKRIIEEKNQRIMAYMRREIQGICIIVALAIAMCVMFILLAFFVLLDITHKDIGWCRTAGVAVGQISMFL